MRTTTKYHRLVTRITATLSLAVCLFSAAANAEVPGYVLDPPPEGFKTVYLFTGARNAGFTSPANRATAVTCTNIDKSKTATVRVEFFGYWDHGPLQGATEKVLGPGEAEVFTTRSVIPFWSEQSAQMEDIGFGNGTGRVLTDSTIKLACMAQSFQDTLHSPYTLQLPMYTPNGRMP